jgi:hypothetical protein
MRFVMVVLTPVPAIPPGLMVQVPVAGRPFNVTLPVGSAHEEGCFIVLVIGAKGASGAAIITTLEDSNEIHPASLVTLKL